MIILQRILILALASNALLLALEISTLLDVYSRHIKWPKWCEFCFFWWIAFFVLLFNHYSFLQSFSFALASAFLSKLLQGIYLRLFS